MPSSKFKHTIFVANSVDEAKNVASHLNKLIGMFHVDGCNVQRDFHKAKFPMYMKERIMNIVKGILLVIRPGYNGEALTPA